MSGILTALIGSYSPVLGAFESIATTTVGSGGASSITFSSIPSTYQHLQVRGIAKDNRGSSNSNSPVKVTFNSDSAANYSYHELAGNGTAASAFGAANTNNFTFNAGPNVANTFGAFILDILDYANTNKYKTARSLGGVDKNGSGSIIMTSGSWRNTNAITSITLTPFDSPLQEFSQFALYGIRG